MKWLIFGISLIIWSYVISGQDIVFPTEQSITYVSGNNKITERDPVYEPGACPANMLLYPGDGNSSEWICDCQGGYLYFPLNNTCHEPFRQGPCKPGQYVVLPKNEAIPKCETNPCKKDGLVPYNNKCYPLRTLGGPCAADQTIAANETTFQLECMPAELDVHIIIQVPKRPCPAGSRRNALGICREVF